MIDRSLDSYILPSCHSLPNRVLHGSSPPFHLASRLLIEKELSSNDSNMDAAHAGNERDEAGAERDEMMEEVEEQEDGYSAFSFHLVTLISLYLLGLLYLTHFIPLVTRYELVE
jgi:hypothetical protein